MNDRQKAEVSSGVGVISRVTHIDSPARANCVVQVDGGGEVRVKGFIRTQLVGLPISFTGKLDTSDRSGRPVYAVEQVEEHLPTSVASISTLLRSCAWDYRFPDGRLEALDAKMAADLVRAFGDETLALLDDPQRLRPRLEPSGLPVDRVVHIAWSWYRARRVHRLHALLTEDLGLDPRVTRLAVRILHDRDPEGDFASMVASNPYVLTDMRARFALRRDQYGIEDKRTAFEIIDSLALERGFSRSAPERLAARALLELKNARGSTALPEKDLFDRVMRSLKDVQAGAVQCTLDAMVSERTDVVDVAVGGVRQIALTGNAHRERQIAGDIIRLRGSGEGVYDSADPKVTDAVASLSFAPDERQTQAIRMALTRKLSVLTGGPGCGKTAITQHVARIVKHAGRKLLMMAPTGRAAQRLAECGIEAVTVAKALGTDRSGNYTYHRENPWDHDYYIIDEASMFDAKMAKALVAALPSKANVLVIGDPNQLPSVDPGNVLQDLLSSGVLPVTRLEVPYRQAADPRLPGVDPTQILANADRILRGDLPVNDDAFLIRYTATEEQAAQKIADWARLAVQARGTFDGIQVVSPQESGPLGCLALNDLLQETLNPRRAGKEEIRYPHTWFDEEDELWYERWVTFRVGDRVIQTRNDYDRYVMNGDIGTIVGISNGKLELQMELKKEPVEISKAELAKLSLAYAITIHKAQGAGYREVLMPLAMSQQRMLTKNLLYTGVTRAKSRVILVGIRDALEWAVSQEADFRRHSLLSEYLRSEDMRYKIDHNVAPKYSYAT